MRNNLTKFNQALGYIAFLLGVIPFCISVLSIFFMPDSVPMHYDSAGNVNRYGSSMEMIIVGLLFSVTAVIMPIAFDRIRMVDYGKLIGFICSVIMEIVFIGLAVYFVRKIFDICDVVRLTTNEEVVAFVCAVIGGVLLLLGSIEYFLLNNSSKSKVKYANVILPIVSCICGSLIMILCLVVKNYFSILILAVSLAVCIITAVLFISKKEKVAK